MFKNRKIIQKFSLIATLIFFSCCNAQVNSSLSNPKLSIQYSQNDTIPKVIYPEKCEAEPPIIVLNGQYVSSEVLKYLNPNMIISVEVRKENVDVNNIQYYGQIVIKTKSGYMVKLIKVNDLLKKYTDLKNKNLIFSIDDKILNSDSDLILVDEKSLMQIKIEKLDKIQKDGNLYLINLVTRTPENIKKANTIYIR